MKKDRLFLELVRRLHEDDVEALRAAMKTFGVLPVLQLRDRGGRNLLMLAIASNSRECVSEILSTRFGSVIARDKDRSGRTALHVAYESQATSANFDRRITRTVEAYSGDADARITIQARVIDSLRDDPDACCFYRRRK